MLPADDNATRLLDYLSNRASQKDPGTVSKITYDVELTRSTFLCVFCGESLRCATTATMASNVRGHRAVALGDLSRHRSIRAARR